MTTEILPRTDKRIAIEALEKMPETVTLAEISEQLAILAGLAKGERDIEEGRTISQEEAKRRSLTWIGT